MPLPEGIQIRTPTASPILAARQPANSGMFDNGLRVNHTNGVAVGPEATEMIDDEQLYAQGVSLGTQPILSSELLWDASQHGFISRHANPDQQISQQTHTNTTSFYDFSAAIYDNGIS